jgi:hypothetical protein
VHAMIGNGNLIKSSFWDDSLILCWASKKRKFVFQCSFIRVGFLKNR